MEMRVRQGFFQNILKIKEMSSQVKFQEEVLLIEKLESQIILHDDDFNTFDWVIECLQKYCEHTEIQAEQCALLTHYKGSCEIVIGEIADLEPVKDDLALYGLNVEIL